MASEVLANLRALAGDRERALVGYDEMAQWFADMRWKTREGYPPSSHTVRLWKRKRGLPVLRLPARPRKVWTTNFLLLIWLANGAGGLTVPSYRWICTRC
jgi:hypothetical protein